LAIEFVLSTDCLTAITPLPYKKKQQEEGEIEESQQEDQSDEE